MEEGKLLRWARPSSRSPRRRSRAEPGSTSRDPSSSQDLPKGRSGAPGSRLTAVPLRGKGPSPLSRALSSPFAGPFGGAEPLLSRPTGRLASHLSSKRQQNRVPFPFPSFATAASRQQNAPARRADASAPFLLPGSMERRQLVVNHLTRAEHHWSIASQKFALMQ
ncbi:uncharacterized protein LOC133377151 isoform X2 [Rhineura floridana]|uniref:uncharacterized protein LOC133377151 isoform X2 n=1 Tax=Rhineura floridana TaxID=261503 RepID=UPI002AC80123|nr:uncharacterized protein LOC133377151 isoform X2 [Rhineura floridana]